jgi:hypothetical protein
MVVLWLQSQPHHNSCTVVVGNLYAKALHNSAYLNKLKTSHHGQQRHQQHATTWGSHSICTRGLALHNEATMMCTSDGALCLMALDLNKL